MLSSALITLGPHEQKLVEDLKEKSAAPALPALSPSQMLWISNQPSSPAPHRIPRPRTPQDPLHVSGESVAPPDSHTTPTHSTPVPTPPRAKTPELLPEVSPPSLMPTPTSTSTSTSTPTSTPSPISSPSVPNQNQDNGDADESERLRLYLVTKQEQMYLLLVSDQSVTHATQVCLRIHVR